VFGGSVSGEYHVQLMRTRLVVITFTAALLCTPVASPADTPGHHPPYLHARTDLHTAQLLLRVHDQPEVMRQLRLVEVETERAIRELDRAGMIDREDMDDHPNVDLSLDRPRRLQKTMELLTKAREHISVREDNPNAAGWRDLATRHIDSAIIQLRRAARDLRIEHLKGF